jgi:hypothetical protein
VKWKEGLRNRKYPAINEPVIVVRVLDTPFFDDSEKPYSALFREPLDILLGLVDSEGDLVTFHYDRRRFEPFKRS